MAPLTVTGDCLCGEASLGPICRDKGGRGGGAGGEGVGTGDWTVEDEGMGEGLAGERCLRVTDAS